MCSCGCCTAATRPTHSDSRNPRESTPRVLSPPARSCSSIRTALLVALGVALTAAPAHAYAPGCNSHACEIRVQVRTAHEKWRSVVNTYPAGVLNARMRCESGGDGGYRLSTTGNGFWFSAQFEPRAWYGAGGRKRNGRPAGVWTMQPSILEQQYRTIIWERIHGGDPWPNCP